jgi:hypothetical protein
MLSNHVECVTGTNFAHWTVDINCPRKFTGGPSGLRQTEPPHTNADPYPLSILTTRQGKQAPSTSQLKSLDTRHNRHWLISNVREFGAVCVYRQMQRNKSEVPGSRMQSRVMCYPMFQGISHQTAFLRINWRERGKAEHTNVSKYYHCNYWMDIFEWHLPDEIVGVKRDVDFTEGALWRNRALTEGPKCVAYASLHQYEGKIWNIALRCLWISEFWKNDINVTKEN